MGLSGSMWTGVSGLLVHGEKMNVVGHNIANVNTIGFKSQRMDFQDMFYNNTYSAGGLEQIGMGARVGMVLNDFSQGPFEQTGLSTDLAIQGKGWFQVRVPGQDVEYYTRAGDFSFNKQGELKNPQGYILQGWKVPLETGPSIGMGVSPAGAVSSPIIGSGVPTDIRLDTWTVPPMQTSSIAMYADLSAYSTDNCRWEANPFAAMFNTWDGQLLDPLNNNLPLDRNNKPYLPESAFSYQSSIKIYDEAGVAHTATIYYDKVEKDYSTPGTIYYDGGKPSQTVWEYIVTINPAEDMRMYCPLDPATGLPGDAVSLQNTKMAGILMSGTLTFSGSGQLIDQTAYTLMGDHEAATLHTSTGSSTLLPGYKAVWTDPNNPSNTRVFLEGDTISAVEMPNTAFYPIINVSNMNSMVASALPNDANPNAYTYPPGYAVPALSDYPSVGGPLVDINGVIHVAPGYQAGSVSTAGLIYKAGEPITDPTDAAWALAGTLPCAGVTAVGLDGKVMPGYQIIISDRGPPEDGTYTAGMSIPPGAIWWLNGTEEVQQIVGAQNIMQSWYPTAVSNNGLPLMVANFTSQEQAMTVGSPKGPNYLIEMDFGLKVPNLSVPWTSTASMGTPRSQGGPFADDPMNIIPGMPFTWADSSGLAGIKGQPVRQAQATNLVGSQSSSTQVSRQNGYTYGNLMDIHIDQYGILSGIYSNGVTIPLYQVVLYDFVAPQHLRFEGGNLVSQTRESGDPSWGAAGTAGFGVVQSYCIEQSNVDLAKEMVHMITTQRGFQANSKVITSVDTMMEVVVNMKR